MPEDEQEQGQALPRPAKVTSYEPFGCGAEQDDDGNVVIRFVVTPQEHVLMTISKEGALGLREQLPEPSKIVMPS